MEPESSLPCSQKPATCICPSQLYPVHSLPSYSPQKHFNIILLPTPTNFTSVSTPKSLHTALPLPHTCQMPSPSHPPYNKRSVPCTKTHHHTFFWLKCRRTCRQIYDLTPDTGNLLLFSAYPSSAAVADSTVCDTNLETVAATTRCFHRLPTVQQSTNTDCGVYRWPW